MESIPVREWFQIAQKLIRNFILEKKNQTFNRDSIAESN